MQNKNDLSLFIFIVIASLSSCVLPRETVERIDNDPKVMSTFPADYNNLFPTPTFEQWDKDYNTFDKFLTAEVKRTQMGLSFMNNGVHIWWCTPSARTHVQLDTATMITDPKSIIGEWRIVCNRKITYEDSASIAEKKIYRDHEIVHDEKQDDLYLAITDSRFNLHLKKKGESTFKRITGRNYDIQSQRYLMLYRLFKAAAAVSFIGLDKDGRLILNSYYVQERKVKGTYIVYQATMTQLIFRRMI